MKTIIDRLPIGWRWVKLRDVCGEIYRYPSFYGIEHQKKGVPVIRGEHISKEGEISKEWEDYWFVGPEISAQYPRTILEKGDLIFTVRGTIGKVGIIRETHEGAQISPNLIRISPKESIDSAFLWFYFQYVRGSTDAVQDNAVTVATVKASDLINLKIPLPPLPEQQRIAARLNEQMAAVAQARQAAEEQLRAARELPAAYLRGTIENANLWERRKLGEICAITAQQVDPKIPEFGSLPHVNGENIESGTCQLLYLNSASKEGMTSQKYLFASGDVLYSKLRPYLRKVVVADFNGVCSADMYPIKVKSDILDPMFLAWMLVSDDFTKYADEESRRARMPKLNREQLFAWEAPIPSLMEQKRIAVFLQDKVKETKSMLKILESQLAEINRLPAALLRQAFSGGL